MGKHSQWFSSQWIIIAAMLERSKKPKVVRTSHGEHDKEDPNARHTRLE